ncbi:MAG: dihydrodipicolinate synthase family protein [Chloroflexota bacterium]|nr:dihydrodipicolinate synthase family protein [Chloroflexota bacterium]
MSDGWRLSGVWPILVTPFDEAGAIDADSLANLVRGTLAVGVDGVVALGVNAEASKLADREREAIVAIVADVCRAEGKPFIVTVSHGGTRVAAERARAAGRAGARAVMVAPPSFARPGPALVEHYRAIGAEGLPVVVQDLPSETGVQLSAELIVELLTAAGGRGGAKVEDPPTAPKIARLRALLGPKVGLVGGLGGMHLLGELRRGADGAMTGFPYPQALLQVYRAMKVGDEDAAEATFRRWLPLLVSCGLPGVGLAVMKEVLRRRGLIRHAGLRQPGPVLDEVALRELERVLPSLPSMDEPLGATR